MLIVASLRINAIYELMHENCNLLGIVLTKNYRSLIMCLLKSVTYPKVWNIKFVIEDQQTLASQFLKFRATQPLACSVFNFSSFHVPAFQVLSLSTSQPLSPSGTQPIRTQPLKSTPGRGTPILGHIRDVHPEWVSFRGPKTCRWV